MAKANYTLDKSSPDFKKLQNPILDGPRARREAGQTESGVCEGRLGGAGHEEASENSFMYFYVQRLGIEGETPLFMSTVLVRSGNYWKTRDLDPPQGGEAPGHYVYITAIGFYEKIGLGP